MPSRVPMTIGSGVSSRMIVEEAMYGSKVLAAGSSGTAPMMSGYSCPERVVMNPSPVLL